MSSSYDSVLIYTSLKCVVLAFCTHWQFEEGEDSPLLGDLGRTLHPLRRWTQLYNWEEAVYHPQGGYHSHNLENFSKATHFLLFK